MLVGSFEEEDERQLTKISRRRQQAILLYALLNLTDDAKATRKSKQKRKRRDPNDLVRESVNDGLFEREYRMGVKAFHKLLGLLEPSISPSPNNKRDDALDAKTVLMITLRFLAGASYIDILRIHGLGRSTTVSHVKRCIKAIAQHKDIGLQKWPENEAECESYAAEWVGR
jgi:hypothetical protein